MKMLSSFYIRAAAGILMSGLFLFLVVFVYSRSVNHGNVPAPAGEVFVSVTDEGFYPDVVEISRNTKVTWTNNGIHDHWPASNFHPTHTEYPSDVSGCIGSALDACRGLKHGEAYSFVFDTSGTWGMHDHLSPGLIMTVRVASSGDGSVGADSLWSRIWGVMAKTGSAGTSKTHVSDSAAFASLDGAKQKRIIQKEISDDPRGAWEYLKSAFIVNGKVVGNAHQFAHLIGNGIYHKLGLAGITICDNAFAYGCYHGVTEAMLLDVGPEKIPDIEKNCISILSHEQKHDYTGCIHGVGHGLLTWSGLHIKQALTGCDFFSQQYRPYCYDGAFMEYADSLPKSAALPKNPWELCDGLNEQYRFNCARYQSLLFVNVFGLSLVQSADACRLADTEKIRYACLGTIGHMIAQQEQANKQKILTRCGELYKEEGYAMCVTYAAQEIRFQNYENSEAVSHELCNSLKASWSDRCRRENSPLINL